MKSADAAQTALGQSAAAAAPKVSAVGAAAQGVSNVIGNLSAKLSTQNKELGILQQELAKATAKYGESSTQAQRKQLAIDKLKTSITATEGAIKSEADAQAAEAKAAAAAAQATETAAAATKDAGQAATSATPPIRELGQSAQQAGSGFSAMREVAIGALREVGAVAVNVMGQAAQAVGAFVAGSVSAAGDFEANMNVFAGVTGDALTQSGKSLDEFKQLFISLGTELPVSTAEVQQAAIELAKGGIDPATIAAGGLRTSLDLAAAGGVGLAESANIMAKQLGVWVDSTADAATKAAFLQQTADLLSQSANATTSDVDELALGLANAGGSAKVAGLDFRETVTGLSLLAPGFSSAADAGTSFKTFVSRLIPTTKPATEAMIALGLATEDGKSKFYDAQGQFIGLSDAAQLLQNATKGLSEEQKSLAFNTIFGADAIRAAAIFAEQGEDGYLRMTQALASAGSVSQQAAARQQGFNTALDNAKGSLEALQLTIGTALLPVLTLLLNDYIAPGINTLTQFAGVITGTNSNIAALSPTMQTLANIFGGFIAFFSDGSLDQLFSGLTDAFGPATAGAIISFASALQSVAPVILDFVTNSQVLVPVLVGLAAVVGGALVAGFVALVAPIAGTVAAITAAAGVAATLYAAWSSNFADIQGIVSTALSGVATVVSSVLATVTGFWSTYGAQIVTTAQTTWGSIVTTVQTVLQALPALVGPILAQVMAFWAANGADIQATVAQVWGQVGGIIQSTMALIQAVVPPVLAAVGAFITAHGADIQAVLSGAWDAVKGIVTTTLSFIQGIINTVLAAVQGDWTGAWTTLQNTSANLVQGLANVVADILGTIPALFNLTMGDSNAAIAGYIGKFKALGSDLINGMVEGIKSQAANVAAAAAAVATAGISSAANAIMSRSPSRLAAETVGAPISQGFAVGILDAAPFAIGAAGQTAQQIIDGAAGVATGQAPAIGAAIIEGLTVGLDADLSSAENQLALATQGLIINTSGMLGASAQTIGASMMQGAAAGVTESAPVLTSAITTATQDAAPDIATVAADHLGAPFTEGFVKGVEESAPTLKLAADAFGKESLKTFPGALKPAISSARDTVSKSKEGFVRAGSDLIKGMAEGIAKATPEVAAKVKASVRSMIDSAKGELQISSPSQVAADEVGAPFVAGIVEGIAATLTQIKAISRTLSKQLTEDMKKVAEEAATAFREVLQAELDAGVGFADTRLANFRKLRDLADGSGTRDAEQGVTDAEQRLKDAQARQLDAEKDYRKKVTSLQQDAVNLDRDRRAEIEKVEADAAKKRQDRLDDDLSAINERSAREVAAIQNDSRLSQATKQRLIAEVQAQADAERSAAEARANDAANDADLQREILRINREYDDKLSEINGKLMEAGDAYEEQTRAINEQVAALQKALDLARARVLVEKELDEERRRIADKAQADLAAAEQEAERIRQFDPGQADEFYKLRSKQILELAQLEQDRLDALRQYRLTGAQEDADRLQQIETERALVEARQTAEQAQFAAKAQSASPYKGLIDQLTELQNKVKAELQRDQGFLNLTDRNNRPMRDRLGREIAGDQATLDQITALLAQVGQAAMGGGVAGVEGGAPALIAAMQAAFEQAKKATEAQLGISSPSKVFAKDVGVPIMAGIAQGISKGQQQVDRALQAAVTPQPATVRPPMTAQQIANTTYNTGNSFSFGNFNGAGVTAAQVKAIVTDAMNRAGRTAYARKATA